MFSCPEVYSCGIHLNVSLTNQRPWFKENSNMGTVETTIEVNRCLSLSGDSCSVETTTKMKTHDFWLLSYSCV